MVDEVGVAFDSDSELLGRQPDGQLVGRRDVGAYI